MSKLAQFINDHRSEFDDKIPPDDLWLKIDQAIPQKAANRFIVSRLFKWSIAAAVMILIGSIVVILVNKKHGGETLVLKVQEKMDTGMAATIPEEAPQVNQFARLIAVKQEELKSITKDHPELYLQFTKDITQLDSSYHILKTRLSLTSNREMLVEAMIQNLQLQLSVLNQQLSIIQKIKQSKKYSHEKNTSFI